MSCAQGSPVCIQHSETELHVTELPVRKWTQDYKEYLESLMKPEERSQAAQLADYKELHTMTHVHFELQALPGAVPEELPEQLLSKFKLTSKLTLSTLPMEAATCLVYEPTPLVKAIASGDAW